MKLLAFELATEACSVALWIDGEVRERYAVAPRRHAELALPWADALLAEAGIAKAALDGIGVGRGPGAFTGVRLAVSIAQGIALALDRPVAAVSTLAALALQAGDGDVLAAIDARMGEVYLGGYRVAGDDVRVLLQEQVGDPASITLAAEAGWRGAGTGFAAADGALQSRLAPGCVVDAAALPHAADVARLAAAMFARGDTCAPERVEPAYLRNNVALTLAQQQARRAAL